MIQINERYLIDVDDEDDDSTEVGTNSSFNITNNETHDYIIVLNLGEGSTMTRSLEMIPELCENIDYILDSCVQITSYSDARGISSKNYKVKESNGLLAYSERGDVVSIEFSFDCKFRHPKYLFKMLYVMYSMIRRNNYQFDMFKVYTKESDYNIYNGQVITYIANFMYCMCNEYTPKVLSDDDFKWFVELYMFATMFFDMKIEGMYEKFCEAIRCNLDTYNKRRVDKYLKMNSNYTGTSIKKVRLGKMYDEMMADGVVDYSTIDNFNILTFLPIYNKNCVDNDIICSFVKEELKKSPRKLKWCELRQYDDMKRVSIVGYLGTIVSEHYPHPIMTYIVSTSNADEYENIFNKLDSIVSGLDKNEFISACKKKFYKSTQI